MGYSILPTIVFVFVFVAAVHAFMPWDWDIEVPGMGGVSHSAITRNAFESRARSYWPSLTRNGIPAKMATARDTISTANGNVDSDQQHSAKHFDGENFLGGQYVLTGLEGYPWLSSRRPLGVDDLPSSDVNLRSQILSHLNSGSGDAARRALGKALHTIQDFYSHSNWVELGNTKPHPGLGRIGNWIDSAGVWESTCTTCGGPTLDPAEIDTCLYECDLLDLDPPFAHMCDADCRCNNCTRNLITDSLTSGYYHGEDAIPPSNGIVKCWHGGDLDPSDNPRDGINKDSLDCSWSSHGPDYHWIAQDLAQKASEQFIDDIRATLTDFHGPTSADQQMRLLFGVSPVLAFVIDNTASMRSVLGPLSTELVKVVNERMNTKSQPSSFVFAPFNDTKITTPKVTSDSTHFIQLIKSLHASGGTNCSKPSMQGLLSTIPFVDVGSSIFLITDGPARDLDLLGTVISAANAKNIHIYTLLFESACRVDGAYDILASATGGRFHTLTGDDVAQITHQIDFWLHSDLTPSFFSKSNSSSSITRRSEDPYIVPICGTTSIVQLTVRGACSVSLFPPDGNLVSSSGIDVVRLSSATFITIDSPEPGLWQAILNGPDLCDLEVASRSAVSFSFSFAEYGGRPGHSGWGPSPNIIPDAEVEVPCLAYIDGHNFSDVNFDIRNDDGDVLLDNLRLTQGDARLGQPPNTFFGYIKLPEENCRIYVTGRDSMGHQFMRVHPIQFMPSLKSKLRAVTFGHRFVSRMHQFHRAPLVPGVDEM